MTNSNGFTLIELMIVVVIIAVLASIAIPSYNEQVTKSKRSDAKSMLLTMASQQERYFYDENQYAANLSALGYSANTVESNEGHYDLSVSAATSTTYTLQAAPKGGQLANDTKCGTLTINSIGQKTESGTASVDVCW